MGRDAAKSASDERVRLDVDERRERLLALGRELFGDRSYEEISIGDIAKAAGISKGLLYHYFPSKRDFYVAVVRDAAQDLLDRTEPPDATPGDVDLLHAKLDAYLEYVEENFRAYALLLRSGIGSDREVLAIVEGTREAFVDRLHTSLPFSVPTPLMRTALRGWVGFVEAASLDWIERRDVGRPELKQLLAQTLLAIVIAAGGQVVT